MSAGLSRLASALGYAGRGWLVFPLAWPTATGCSCGDSHCNSPAKHPHGKLAPHGLKDATTCEDTIRAWWTAAPAANIGIACEASGLVVLDVDPRHGGDRSLEQLQAITGPLDTAVVNTGGGGRHFIFQANGTRITSRALDTDLYPGLDVKACGGYVVGGGSDHISGGRYTWGGSSAPRPIPATLLQVLPKRGAERPVPADGAVVKKTGAQISDGARNVALTRLAGRLRHAGLEPGELAAALQAANVGRCDPPLPEREVETVARSIGRYEAGGAAPGTDRSVELIDDVNLLTRPALPEQIPGWLNLSTLLVIYGPSGVGKTLLAILMALCQTTGRDWLGIPVQARGPAVLVAGEGVGGLPARVRAAKTALDLPLETPAGLHVYPEAVNLMDAVSVAQFIATVKPIEPTLIMLDTFARCLIGGDENSAGDVGRAITACDLIRRETGATVAPIHHTGKNGDTERGSSALRGAADTMLKLTDIGGDLRLESDKQKDLSPADPLTLRIVTVPETGSVTLRLAREVLVSGLSDQQRRALHGLAAAFGAGDSANMAEWAKACTVPERTLYLVRQQLRNLGFVTEARKRWTATPAGRRIRGSAMTCNATCNEGCNGLSSRLQEKHPGKPDLQPGCNATCNDSAMLRPLYREGRVAGLQLQWTAKIIDGLTATPESVLRVSL